MTGPWVDDSVDQAFFGVSATIGGHGMITCSFPDSHRGMWQSRLKDHTRLDPVHGGTLPSSAMSYIRFDDRMAAIVRRVDRGHSQARGNAHILIGSAEALDVSLSLGLADWPGWQDDPPMRMTRVGVGALLEAAGRTSWSPRSAERLEDQLVAVLTRLLEEPGRPLSVIGCPDADRLTVVRGLRGAAGDYLRHWDWTYSTYTTRHENSILNLPEVLFLPEVPKGGGVAHRTVVDLREEPRDGLYRSQATALVNAFLRGGEAPRPLVRQIAGVAVGQQSVDKSVPVDGTGNGVEVSNLGKQWGDRLVAAKSVGALLDEVNLLAAQGSDVRSQVRKSVGPAAVDQIADLVEKDAEDNLWGVLRALYGPDLADIRTSPEARRHVVKLVEGSGSGQLVRLVGFKAASFEKQEVTSAALMRWDARLAKSKRLRTRRPGKPFGGIAVHWPKLIAAALVVFALLGVVFLLGYRTGRPEAVPQTPVAGEVTSTSQPPQASNAPPKTGREVRVSAMDSNRTLYAFLRTNDVYYPQQPCTKVEDDDADTLWRCAPLASPIDKSDLVAVAVLLGEVPALDAAAQSGLRSSYSQAWGNPVVVR